MDRFKGKTALITGGTTGIGLATAKLFINEGARVIVTGRTSATIKTAQAELGDNAVVIHSDATSLPDMLSPVFICFDVLHTREYDKHSCNARIFVRIGN